MMIKCRCLILGLLINIRNQLNTRGFSTTHVKPKTCSNIGFKIKNVDLSNTTYVSSIKLDAQNSTLY